MRQKVRKYLNFVLIFGTLCIVLIIGFTNGNDLQQTLKVIGSVPLRTMLLCAAAYFGYLGMDALALWFFLRRQGSPVSAGYAVYVTIIGHYYSNITPGASGGQPMQVYYLRRKEIPVGLGTSAMVVKLFSFQFMLMVLGTGFWIAYADYIRECLGGNMWILIVGYAYNAVVVIILVLMGLKKRPALWIVNTCIRIGAKLRLCKNPEAAREHWGETVNLFHDSIQLLRKRPADLLTQLAIGGLQLLSLMSVIYILYRGFRLQGADWGMITALGLMIYTSAGYTPLPGASGAQEGVFSLYLSGVFPSEYLFSALLLWRFFTYYLSLLLGAVVTVGSTLKRGGKKR